MEVARRADCLQRECDFRAPRRDQASARVAQTLLDPLLRGLVETGGRFL
jgi:hypothetical protein